MDGANLNPITGVFDVIKVGVQQKKGKGVRRLNGLVESYLRLSEAALEDGKLTPAEELMLDGIARSIVDQCQKLADP